MPLKLWRSYCSRHLRMLVLLGASTLIISSCSPLDLAKGALGAAVGSGPSVNAQVGKENVQGVNVRNEAPRLTADTVDTVDQSTVNNNVDYLLLAVAIIGWLAPSPGEIGRGLSNLFRRK